MADTAELRILICAPYGKDALLTADVLKSAGMSSHLCKDLAELVRELSQGAGAVLTVEEALTPAASAPLSEYIAQQPTWSDLPVIVLTKPGGKSPWIQGAYERLGNLTLLERPVRASTLISAARSTLRARQRQYEIYKTDQRKDEFLAMLGHELRNPLAPIGAAAQLLSYVSSDPEKVKQSSEIIVRQVKHMTGLIDDLLDVARVTRGLIELDKQPVDMRQILSDAVEQVGPSIRARRHHISLHLTPDPATVQGDRKRLIQVVANVLNNASKYTPEGGNITARLAVHADSVVLEIADDGIGMAPDLVSRVFQLFAQAERSSDRSQGGLGLGLSLVQSLMQSHGGSVEAKSGGLGKGSAFTIRLPRMHNAPATEGDQNSASKEMQRTSTPLQVLIVDDNADAATTMAMLLDASGYDVSVRLTAASAIEHARAISPQVCLLDIGLPDMDGNELAKRLRQMPETANAVLVAVTGYGQEQDREKTKAAGFDRHFVKPVDAGQILALLAQVT
jgi:signal transduction histidine kinase/ActR/RegA family two-component response regulator